MKTPPHEIEIEKAVLGAMLLDQACIIDAIDILNADSFFDPRHQKVFIAINNLYQRHEPVDKLTVTKSVEGVEPHFISGLTGGVASGANIQAHAMILKEREISRRVIKDIGEVYSDSFDKDPLDLVGDLIKKTEGIANLCDLSKPTSSSDLVDSVIDNAFKAMNNGGKITGLPTGFWELDEIYAGRQRTDLIIKAGRPAMGKTAQALCEAKYMALDAGLRVAFFSLEMGAEQLMQRLVSVVSGVPAFALKTGDLRIEQVEHLPRWAEPLKTDRLTIIDDCYTLDSIKTKARKLKVTTGLDAIYIDYLQLIVNKVGKGRSRENEVSEISRNLKMLAKALDVPVIALSQLSRECEKREDKKPMLSDLRESGAIEQDADVVEFVYRPEYYDSLEQVVAENHLEGKAFVLIAKHRHGATKDCKFNFNAALTRFENE